MLGFGASAFCPNTAATNATKPLYLLVLHHGSSNTPRSLAGLRIAQEEINSRTGLLPGYRIELIIDKLKSCYSREMSATVGLTKFVKHTVNPPCRPVVAVMGLSCSSLTSMLSPVAGHDGYDLIQLSSFNSPLLQNHHFPHLWRLSGSATVYSDTVLAIMDQFNWTKIGVIYNSDSALYSEIAIHLARKIKVSGNKSVPFSLGIRGTKLYYLDAVISEIISKETAVIFCLIYSSQLRALMPKIIHVGLVYPHYILIHIGKYHIYHAARDFFARNTVGHMYLDPRLPADSENTRLFSNETIATLKVKYAGLLHKLYNTNDQLPAMYLSTKFYDQVWTIALAVNNSLTVLENRNISIDNYTIGQPEVTKVIEEQMANLSFQGASGWIEFQHDHSVATPMVVRWMLPNGALIHVGTYNPLNRSDFKINIRSIDLPEDTAPRVYKYILIPLPITIVLYIFTGVVVMFITVQLFLYLHYRHHQVIKATSPYLSLLMFAGCYLFTAAALQLNTYGSFLLSPKTFTVMSITNYVFITNGVSLVVVTMFVKLLRMHRIFSFWMKQDPNKLWSSFSLFIVVLLVSFIPNIVIGILIVLRPPLYSTYSNMYLQDYKITIEVHTRIEPISNYTFTSLISMYTCIFLALVLFMGFCNRKIKMRNFNSSGQIYLLLVVLVITICLAMSIVILFLVKEQEPVANAVLTSLFLIFATACQLILFFPKILMIALEDKSPYLLANFQSLFLVIQNAVFS